MAAVASERWRDGGQGVRVGLRHWRLGNRRRRRASPEGRSVAAMEQKVVYGGLQRRVKQRWLRVLPENVGTDDQREGCGLGLCCKRFQQMRCVPVNDAAVLTAEDAALWPYGSVLVIEVKSQTFE